MLLGMIRPNQGACYINGEKVSLTNSSIWKKVGYMVETTYSYPELTVEENLKVYGRLRLISDRQSIAKVMNQLQLTMHVHFHIHSGLHGRNGRKKNTLESR